VHKGCYVSITNYGDTYVASSQNAVSFKLCGEGMTPHRNIHVICGNIYTFIFDLGLGGWGEVVTV